MISRHTYTAETDLGTDLSLTGGSITLDAGRIPHAEADIVLAVEDAALLDQLDPRASRRVTIGATREGHEEIVYTPWVEERRNLCAYTGAGTSTAGYSGYRATVSNPGGYLRAVVTEAVNGGCGIQMSPGVAMPAAAPGQRWSWSAELRGTGTTAALYAQFFNASNAIVGGSQVIGARGELHPSEWREFEVFATAPATTAYTRIVAVIYSGSAVGSVLEARRITAERTAVSLGSPFDGNVNPDGDLERTRWLGTPNASPSVIEARRIAEVVWIPEGFRFFDLGIREARPDRAAGTVRLALASDEAVLQDYAQLVDDKSPRGLETSLRAICTYVLGKIGATLEPGPEDADVTAYWPITNLLANPGVEADPVSNWATGAGASALARTGLPRTGAWALRFTAAAGDANVVPTSSSSERFAVQPGEWYVFAFYGRSSAATQMRAAIQWWTQNGVVPASTSFGALAVSSTSEYTRYFVIAQAPAGVTHAYPYVNTRGNTAGRFHYVDDAMFYAGDELVDYFDGSTMLPGYVVEWQEAANASASTRTPLVERRPEALVWDAGTSGMAFLQPLLMAAGLRLVCDEQRRFTLRGESYRADGSQSWRYGVNITAADENLSRDDDTWYDAAVYVYLWTDSSGIEQRRVDAYGLTPTPTKVLRVELRDTPFPGPGRAEHVVRRAQGKGRTVSVAGIPRWTEHTDQDLAVILDGTPIQTGISSQVRFDLDTDTVTVSSRTTDTPAGAIDLLPGTINALPGTINSL